MKERSKEAENWRIIAISSVMIMLLVVSITAGVLQNANKKDEWYEVTKVPTTDGDTVLVATDSSGNPVAVSEDTSVGENLELWGSTRITDNHLGTDWVALPDSGNITFGDDTNMSIWYNSTANKLQTAGTWDFGGGSIDNLSSLNTEQVFTNSRSTDIVVHKLDDGTIKADGTSSEIDSGTDFATVMQSAVDKIQSRGGGKVVVKSGTYLGHDISLPSNIGIEVVEGATLKVPDGVDADTQMFTNKDQTGGNNNIYIYGKGTLHGNSENQLSGVMYPVNFKKVSGELKIFMENWRNVNPKVNNIQYQGEFDWENLHYNPKYNKEIMYYDCEDLSDTTITFSGTSSAETGDNLVYEGSQSMKLEVGEGNVESLGLDIFSDMRYKFLSFRLKITDQYSADSLTLHGFDGDDWPNQEFDGDIDDAWHQKVFDLTTMYGSDYTPDILENGPGGNTCEIKVENTGSSGPLTVYVDNFKLVPKDSKPRVMFTFDDNWDEHYTIGAKYLSKYNFPGVAVTNFVSPSSVDRMSYGQIKSLSEDYGWEIIPHPTFSTSDNISVIAEELIAKKREAENLGIDTNFMIGSGHAGDIESLNMMKNIAYTFRYAGGVCSPNAFGPIGMANPFKARHPTNYYLSSDPADLASAKTAIDYAHKRNKPVVFLFHHLDESGAITESDFEDTVDYVKEMGLEVVTPTEYYNTRADEEWDKLGNWDECLVDKQSFTISGDGGTQVFDIGTHDMLYNPDSRDEMVFTASPTSTDAINASPIQIVLRDNDGDEYYEDLEVRFSSAPANGTDNVSFVVKGEIVVGK